MRTSMRLLIILLMVLAAASAYAAEYHVNLDGTGDFTSIQAAIDAAVDGDTVIVHPGTYYENIEFKGKNITLRSTEPTDWSVVEATVIDGGQKGTVVTFAGTEDETCLLAGLTITNGKRYVGGGISGGGDPGARATIKDCIVTGNEGWPGGGVICCDGLIERCIVSNNSTSGCVGGLFCCDGTIANCLIVGNRGGLDQWRGGGLAGCDGRIVNCTIAYNSAYEGGGLSMCRGVNTNLILWGDEGGELFCCSTTYSCVKGGATGEGNISDDPLFVSGPFGDYYLSCKAAGQAADSPCIDEGTGMAADYCLDAYTTRTDGVPDGGIVDMGFHYPTAEAQVDVRVSCSLNADHFVLGDVLQGFMSVENRGADIVVDIFAVITMPDGSMVSLTQNGFALGIWPWYCDLILPSGFAAGPEMVFEEAIPAGAAPGNYTYMAAITRAGMGCSGILSIDQCSFEVAGLPVSP